MRLLHVTHQYRPALGGSEQFFTDLSEELVRMGHEVDVLTTRATDYRTWAPALPPEETLEGVRVRRCRSVRRRGYTWRLLDYGLRNYRRTGRRVYEPLILAGSGPIAPGIAARVLASGRRYDAVHVQTLPYAHVVYAAAAARAVGVPLVVTPHVHVDQPDVFRVGCFDRALRSAQLVVADTGREIEYFRNIGVPEDRMIEVGVGLRTERFPAIDRRVARSRLGLPDSAFVVLYLGRKVSYKGLPSVVAAFRQLAPRHPSLWLVSAGPEGDLPPTGTDPAHRWRDYGAVTEEERLLLLNACDVLVLPSVAEAFGIVFLEAWSVGRAVVGARAGATPWLVVHGHDGLLVEPHDVNDLAVSLERLMLTPGLLPWLSGNGQRKVRERYALPVVARRMESAYRTLVAGRHRRRIVTAESMETVGP